MKKEIHILFNTSAHIDKKVIDFLDLLEKKGFILDGKIVYDEKNEDELNEILKLMPNCFKLNN